MNAIGKTKEVFSVERMLILIIFVLLTAIAIGGVIWWGLRATYIIQQRHINSLNSQIDNYQVKISEISQK